MAKQTINIGSAANDGTGDPLRTAFDKINDNFQEIYSQLGGGHQSAGQTTLANIAFSGNKIENVVTNGDISIEPNGTGKVIITSDLEVLGSSTQMNTTTMTVEDNLVEFNNSNSGGSDIDAGIYINRGSAGNAAVFYWNEGDDKFKAVTSTSAASVTAVTDTATATIVANFEGDSLAVNNINANDSSAISINTAVQISGVLSADSIDTNRIVSNDSTAVTIGEDLIVDGNLQANNIDTNKIFNSDSGGIEINSDLRVLGNSHSEKVITQEIYSNDSTAVLVQDNLDINGTLRVSTINGYSGTTVAISNGLDIGGSLQFAVSDNLGTSTTALSTSVAVHSLAAGEQGYTLANGVEGQIMYFTIAGDSSAVSSTAITISNVRNPIDGDVDASYVWYPFIIAMSAGDSTQGRRSLATALFANGAWNLDFYPG